MDAEPTLQRAMRRRIESSTGDGQGVEAAAALAWEKAEFDSALAAAVPEWCGAEPGLEFAPEREAEREVGAGAGRAPVPVPVPVIVYVIVIVPVVLFVWA